MIKVQFLGPINKESINVDVKNLSELKELLNKDKDIKIWLKDCAIALNDEIISDIKTELKSGDTVSILPPVCGG